MIELERAEEHTISLRHVGIVAQQQVGDAVARIVRVQLTRVEVEVGSRCPVWLLAGRVDIDESTRFDRVVAVNLCEVIGEGKRLRFTSPGGGEGRDVESATTV